MQRRASKLAIAAFALTSWPAGAQDTGSATDDGFGGQQVSSGDPAPPNETQPPLDENAPERYTVQPGDTLWGLSQRFLNNPWYWPRIWAYNPQLDNPNWLKPGNEIRFYPGPDEAPVQVVAPVTLSEPPSDSEDVDVGDFEEIPVFEVTHDLEAALRRMPGENTERLRREFLVSDDALEGAGELTHAPEPKQMLTAYDRTFLRTKEQPAAGEELHVFREVRDVTHPITGENLGKVVEVLGTIRVDTVSEDEHLATVTTAWGDIRRGDRVGNLGELRVAQIGERGNDKDVKGYIVEAARYPLAHVGENHLVFLDRGRDDGVAPGNTFVVVRTGDPLTGDLRGMADEDIGRVLVLDVSTRAATGIVTFSNREILPGDRIEMRAK